MDAIDHAKLNISLEPHLVEVLRPLPNLLPLALANELNTYILDTSANVIPYSTLLAISQWARTAEGREKLEENTPPLKSNSYLIVSLLAGTKTSPERIFGTYIPPPQPEQLAEQQKRERQEITAILNALLSIFGVGFATWWAAGTLHWKDQGRVLLALGASLVVAIAESGLFVIWRSRQDARRKSRFKARKVRYEKTENPGAESHETRIIVGPQQSSELRQSPTGILRQRRL